MFICTVLQFVCVVFEANCFEIAATYYINLRSLSGYCQISQQGIDNEINNLKCIVQIDPITDFLLQGGKSLSVSAKSENPTKLR